MYTSVAIHDDQNQDASMISAMVESDRPGSSEKRQSEVGGTGTEDEPQRPPTHFHISIVDKNDTMHSCGKKGCSLRAFGKCEWENPWRIPKKTGGCGIYFCEFHGAQFENFRKYQVCQECNVQFMNYRALRMKLRVALIVTAVVIFLGCMTMVGIFGAKKAQSSDQQELLEHEQQVKEILNGQREMTKEISEWWSKQAHDITNQMRADQGLTPLDWSW